MALPNTHIQIALTTASSLMGVLALSGGLYGLASPLSFSSTLGIPITSPSSSTLPLISFIAARNLGSGLTLLMLLATGALGHRKVVGLALMCGTIVAFADAWICGSFGAEEGKAMGHAGMGVIAGVLGAGMWWGH